MMTERPHPRHAAGLPRVPNSRGYDAGSWMKMNCGDRVCRKDDPRHCGRVEAIHNSAVVKVVWNGDPPLVEFVALGDLVRSKGE